MTRGTVLIDSDRCKACGLCIAVCPQHLLSLSSSLNRRGYHPVELLTQPSCDATHSGGCTGCGLCALVCPDVVFTVLREPPQPRTVVRPPAPSTQARLERIPA